MKGTDSQVRSKWCILSLIRKGTQGTQFSSKLGKAALGNTMWPHDLRLGLWDKAFGFVALDEVERKIAWNLGMPVSIDWHLRNLSESEPN